MTAGDVVTTTKGHARRTGGRSGFVPRDGRGWYRGTMWPTGTESYGQSMAENCVRLQPRRGSFAMDVGRAKDDGPTWTDILRAIAVRKRREEMAHLTASRAL
jgi:hypothetical protein